MGLRVTPQDAVVDFAARRISQMLDRPGMWGGEFFVELLVIQMLEVREVALAAPMAPPPRKVIDAFISFSDRMMGDRNAQCLWDRVCRAGRQGEFCGMLRQFADEMGARTSPLVPKLFGVDYDGTLSADPALFSQAIALILQRGHGVVVVTGRSDEGRWGEEVRAAVAAVSPAHQIPIVFAGNRWKRQAAEEAGHAVDIWWDDNPEYVAPQDPDRRQLKPL